MARHFNRADMAFNDVRFLIARIASQISEFGFSKEFKSYLSDYTCFGEARCMPTISQLGTQKNCIRRKQKWPI
jgi:hypothetical protein